MNKPMNVLALMRRLGIDVKPVVDVVVIPATKSEVPKTMTMDERSEIVEHWNERAAIMEHVGGIDRDYAEKSAWSEIYSQLKKQHVDPLQELMPVSVSCCFCEGRFLIDDSEGCRCWSCERLVWISTPEGSIVRADFAKVEL